MRRLFLLAALFGALGGTPALAAPVFIVDGRGWGHGIGMPQYGAYGYALKEGRSYGWILEHYYPGTKLGSSPVDDVRVLLADDRSSLTIGSDAAFAATDSAGRSYTLPAGSVQLGPSLKVTIDGETKTLASPVRFTRGNRFLELGGRPYRGQLVVRSSGGTLSAVNHVGLEEYLYGVVPDEMPPSWAMEALKAQAVAARSYAVVSRRSGGVFDLFSDTRSQVYGGVASEEARTNAAIAATAGRVLFYGGRVAWTFFHSTSGGRTAAIDDVWNAAPVPYLVSVPDPYDSLSPYHRWGPLRYTAKGLSARLGSLAPAGRLADVTLTRNASGRVDALAARGTRGTKRFSGSSFQSRLGLRSSWFSVAVLGVSGPARVEFGRAVTLRGIARGVRSAFLERRNWDGRWRRLGRLVRQDGVFKVEQRPTISGWYRVASSKGRSPAHRVDVAPWIRFSEVRNDTTLVGRVRPQKAGVGVVIQRRTDGRWGSVARGVTGARGRFAITLELKPGAYRAIAALGPGYAAGRTPVLHVVAP